MRYGLLTIQSWLEIYWDKALFYIQSTRTCFPDGNAGSFCKAKSFFYIQTYFFALWYLPAFVSGKGEIERQKKVVCNFVHFLYIYITFTKGTRHQVPAVWPYLGKTEAPTDMVGVPTNQAWPEDHAGAIKNLEFRIRTELEPENRFSCFAQFWLNQGTYRHLQGTCGSGLI